MSWHFSQALVAAFSAGTCSAGDASAPWSSTPSAPDDSCSAKMKAICHRSPFGTMYVPSTDTHGAALLTWFLAAFRAKTSAPPAKARASKASDPDCGWKWPGSFAKFSPASRSWKTRQCSLLAGLESYSETWPRWGLMRDGECLAQPMPVLRTSESGSGLWPTVRSSDGERGGRGDLIQAVRGNPNSHYSMWTTPSASDATRGGTITENMTGTSLAQQINTPTMWPTPHGFSKDGKSNGPSGNELGRAVNQSQRFPTPCSSDHKGSSKPGQRRGQLTDPAMGAIPAGGSLNPTWVAWLMGWPLGWTSCEPLATDKFQQWQRLHGRC